MEDVHEDEGRASIPGAFCLLEANISLSGMTPSISHQLTPSFLFTGAALGSHLAAGVWQEDRRPGTASVFR